MSDHAVICLVLDFCYPVATTQKLLSYLCYHKIDMDQFCSDLRMIPFVSMPSCGATELHVQYVEGLTEVLDKPPVKSRSLKSRPTDWLTDSYRIAQSLRRQYERVCMRKHKTHVNRSRLRKQIAWCNRLTNKDKGSYYNNIISANSDDPRKLCDALKKVLH